MTDEVIRKLEEGFIKGFSDRQACLFADIAPSTLYKFCQEHPEFSERKELLKEQLKLRAKMNIAAALNEGNLSLSQWYAERTMKDEFSSRSEVTGADGQPLIPERKEEINKALDHIIPQ